METPPKNCLNCLSTFSGVMIRKLQCSVFWAQDLRIDRGLAKRKSWLWTADVY